MKASTRATVIVPVYDTQKCGESVHFDAPFGQESVSRSLQGYLPFLGKALGYSGAWLQPDFPMLV